MDGQTQQTILSALTLCQSSSDFKLKVKHYNAPVIGMSSESSSVPLW